MSGRNERILQSILNNAEYSERPYSRIEYLLLQLKNLIETIQNTAYEVKGNSTFSALPTTLTKSMNGWVYNVTDAFETTNLFVEGAGKNYPANTNVVIVDISATDTPVMRYDVIGAFIDVDALYAAINAVSAMIAAEFSVDTAYASGTILTYNGKLYRLTTAHTAGTAWDASAAVEITVIDLISACYTKAETDTIFIKKDSINIVDTATTAEINAAIAAIWGA